MSKLRPAFSVLLLAVGIGLTSRYLILYGAGDAGIDYRVFQRAMATPLNAIYHDRSALPFLYPPTAIPLFKAAVALPGGFWTWGILSAAAFAAAVAAVSGKQAAALSLGSTAAAKGLVFGQVPMLLGAGVFAGLKLPPIAGGALWGVVAAVKPQLMLFAPIALLVRRDWRLLGGMAAGGIIWFLVSLAWFGPSLWLQWLAAIGGYTETLTTGVAVRTITPAGIAANLGFSRTFFLLAGAAIGAAAIISAARKVEGEMLVALIVAASLVASPYAHTHDTIAIIPACVALILRGHWVAAIPAALIFIGTPGLTMVSLMSGLIACACWGLRAKKDEFGHPPPAGQN